MKNKISDLNNYLFEEIERLTDDMNDKEFDKAIKRSDAVVKVAKTIIDNGSLALQTIKHFNELGLKHNCDMELLGVSEIKKNKNI